MEANRGRSADGTCKTPLSLPSLYPTSLTLFVVLSGVHSTAHRIWLAYDEKLLPAEVLLKRFGQQIHCLDCWKVQLGVFNGKHGANHTHRGPKKVKGKATAANPDSKRSKKKAAAAAAKK
jgi:hypothetical protein